MGKHNNGHRGANSPTNGGNGNPGTEAAKASDATNGNANSRQDESQTDSPNGNGSQSEAGGGNPPVPPKPPETNPTVADKCEKGARRIRNAALKGKKFNIGNGEIVAVDGEGVFEVEAAAAERLLSIPGFEEV